MRDRTLQNVYAACIIVGIFAFLTPSAHAAYVASGVLGQNSMTTGCINQSADATGVAPSLSVALDDVHHRLFESDAGNSRVLVFNLDSTNHLVDYTADYVLGQPDFTTCAAQAVSSRSLSAPRGVAYDPTNDLLYVGDAGHYRVMIFDVSTITNYMPAVHELGQVDFTSSVNPLSTPGRTSVYSPNMLTVDTHGRLYVADSLNRVMVWSVPVTTDNADALSVLGQPDFTTATNGATAAKMYNPHGVAYDPTNNYLFVSDDLNGRIQVFDVASVSVGESAIFSLGTGTDNTNHGLGRTLGVAYDDAHKRLFAGDFSYNKVVVWDFNQFPLANNATESFVLGSQFTRVGSSSLDAAHFGGVHGIAFDASTNEAYITDPNHSRVLLFDNSSLANEMNATNVLNQSVSGVPTFTKGSPNNGPNQRGFYTPNSVVLDSTRHRLFVVDSNNNRILVYNLSSTNQVLSQDANYVLGQTDFTSNTAGTSRSRFNSSNTKIAYDEVHQRLFVAVYAENRVLVYDFSGGITNGMNAAYVLGQTDFVSTGSANTQSGLSSPIGAGYDPVSNYLYVMEYAAHRVKVFDLSGGITNGMNAKAVLGQSTWSGASSGTTATTMKNPFGACIDSAGRRLFIAEYLNNRVTEFDITTVASGQAALHVFGQADLLHGTGSTSATGLSNPLDCAYDSANDRLYVAEYGGRRVVGYDTSTITDGEAAVVVLGQNDFVTAANSATADHFIGHARSVAVDGTNGHIYATDEDGDRILIFDTISLSTGSLAGATTNVSYSASPQSQSQGTVAFTLDSGALPSGITLTSSISGVPTAAGSYSFTVHATDDNGAIGTFRSSQVAYSLTVTDPGASRHPETSGGGTVAATPTPTPAPTSASSPTPTPSPAVGPASGGSPAQFGLHEGETVSSPGSNDPDVYIINEFGYKRLFLNPIIFSFYGHLGGFAAVHAISATTRDAFPTSGLFRNCETNDQKVYAVQVTGEDTGILHWVDISGDAAVAQDPNFFQKVFCINSNEFGWYAKGSDYRALSDVPVYQRQ